MFLDEVPTKRICVVVAVIVVTSLHLDAVLLVGWLRCCLLIGGGSIFGVAVGKVVYGVALLFFMTVNDGNATIGQAE